MLCVLKKSLKGRKKLNTSVKEQRVSVAEKYAEVVVGRNTYG